MPSLVAGKLNAKYLESIINHHIDECIEVIAIVAYCDSSRLFEICKRAGKKVSYYGRLDDGIPVTSNVLSWFLDQASPNYSCYLLRGGLHAKVIWLKGEGVYIGSANLTDRGWMSNIEAGVYLSESELTESQCFEQLEAFVTAVQDRSVRITSELVGFVRELENRRAAVRNGEKGLSDWFDRNCKIREIPSLVAVDLIKSQDQRNVWFIKEWNSTLQLLRDIQVKLKNYRPSWVNESVPDGVHVDQFLHAYYYLRVRDGNRQPFDEHYEKNKSNPEIALLEQMRWWQTGDYPHEDETQFIHEWAPSSRELLGKERVRSLSVEEFVKLCSQVHAIRDHAIKIEGQLLGLPAGYHDRVIRLEAFGRWLFKQRTIKNNGPLETIYYVLYGGQRNQVPERLWDAAHNPEWKIEHMGLSSLGEIVGWALPDNFPPRNSRTSKALRALGNDVKIY